MHKSCYTAIISQYDEAIHDRAGEEQVHPRAPGQVSQDTRARPALHDTGARQHTLQSVDERAGHPRRQPASHHQR